MRISNLFVLVSALCTIVVGAFGLPTGSIATASAAERQTTAVTAPAAKQASAAPVFNADVENCQDVWYTLGDGTQVLRLVCDINLRGSTTSYSVVVYPNTIDQLYQDGWRQDVQGPVEYHGGVDAHIITDLEFRYRVANSKLR